MLADILLLAPRSLARLLFAPMDSFPIYPEETFHL